MKILLISGHTSGHNPSQLTGVNEGDLNIELVKKLKTRLDAYADVSVYPYDRDMYHDNKNGCLRVNLGEYDYILEIHFNAFNNVANGTEIYIHQNYTGGTSVEEKILKNIVELGFRNRGLKRMNDLLNMNTCFNLKKDYALLETCFFDNAQDMGWYKTNKNKVAAAIADGIINGFGLTAAKPVEIPNEDAALLRQMSTLEFIEFMGPKATEDQRKNGMLACVTVAQSCLETGYGKTELACGLGASEANIAANGTMYGARNMFGMKVGISAGTWGSTVWDGKKYRKMTAEQNKDGSYTNIWADFRSYETIDQSIEDRAQYFTKARLSAGGPLRYPGIVGETDYERVIDIMVAGQYATSLNYKKNLIRIIEQYDLTRFNLSNYKSWIAKVVDADSLNVRKTPNGELLKMNLSSLPAIEVIGESKDGDGDIWYKVKVGSSYTGYVYSKYLSR